MERFIKVIVEREKESRRAKEREIRERKLEVGKKGGK